MVVARQQQPFPVVRVPKSSEHGLATCPDLTVRSCLRAGQFGGWRAYTGLKSVMASHPSAGSRTSPDPKEPGFRIADYVSTIENGRNEIERFRMIVCDLPRRFHAASRPIQECSLTDPPSLTGTKWDALLAAMAEHLAILHDHEIPAWCDEPERFLRLPWVPLGELLPGICASAYIDTPASFVRHGALVEPSSLDRRGGEREYGFLVRG